MTPLTAQLPEPVRVLLRTANWHRRLLASGCAAAAVAFALSVLAPKPPAVVRVLAAARDVPAGATLTTADVHVVRLPRAVVPSGALVAADAVTGRVVAGPLRRGEPLTDVRLVGTSLFSAAGDGMVAAPIRIADPGAARLLQAGDLVDVLASSDHSSSSLAATVATGVRVLAVPAPGDAPGGIDDGALVVIATTPSTAALLARAATTDRLSVVIRGG